MNDGRNARLRALASSPGLNPFRRLTAILLGVGITFCFCMPVANGAERQLSTGKVKSGISHEFRGAARAIEEFYSELAADATQLLGDEKNASVPYLLVVGSRNAMKWEEERVRELSVVGAKDACLYYSRILAQANLGISGARGLYSSFKDRCKSQSELDELNRRYDRLETLQDGLRARSLEAYSLIEAYVIERE